MFPSGSLRQNAARRSAVRSGRKQHRAMRVRHLTVALLALVLLLAAPRSDALRPAASRGRRRSTRLGAASGGVEPAGNADGVPTRSSAQVRPPRKILGRNLGRAQKPGTLILVRHGESEWNANYTFTGWADPDLSDLGRREVKRAARLLLEGGYSVDKAYTSVLKRAVSTSWILLRELELVYLPVIKDFRLNERMYGALTGLSKPEEARKSGEKLVQAWRRSLRVRPPALDESHPYYPGRERKYAHLAKSEIPLTESLLDTMERSVPLWEEQIKRDLAAGQNVLVAAHANSLRGLIKHIDGISEEDIPSVHVPNCIPLVYKFDETMAPIRQPGAQGPLSGFYLETKEATRAALKREAQLSRNLPGYEPGYSLETPMLRALSTLQREREAARQAEEAEAVRAAESAAGAAARAADGAAAGGSMAAVGDAALFGVDSSVALAAAPAAGAAEEAAQESAAAAGAPGGAKDEAGPKYPEQPAPRGPRDRPIGADPVVVLLRHGKTEYNKLGLFTGWEDAPLSKEGIEEARRAGRLLKYHGVQFDVVHTSWLSRAIETAWLALEEMDETWVPLIKSWRLNERMYGALTGLSKKMIAQRHGQERLKAWRRSYGTRPPAVSSFSRHYPGNDRRYVQYVSDTRVSVKETVLRFLESGRLKKHRKLPHTESLKDCMERTIPYYTNVIVPTAINRGQSVLISSSENAIRGLLMHLCDIPPETICDIEIPTGLPMIYSPRERCIKLLEDPKDDGEKQYDFGAAGEMIFQPCSVDWMYEEAEAADALAADDPRAAERRDAISQRPRAAG